MGFRLNLDAIVVWHHGRARASPRADISATSYEMVGTCFRYPLLDTTSDTVGPYKMTNLTP
jgi:hypothetical protein